MVCNFKLEKKKKKTTLNPVLTFASEEMEAQNCIMSCPWSLSFKWQGGTGAQFPDPEAFSPTSNPSLNTSPASSLSCRWMAWWLRAHTWKWMLEVGTQTETRSPRSLDYPVTIHDLSLVRPRFWADPLFTNSGSLALPFIQIHPGWLPALSWGT